MNLDFEEHIIDVVNHVSKELGDTLDVSTLRWVGRPATKGDVMDASQAFYVDGKRRSDDVVLLLSNESFGHTVAEDVARARAVAGRVDQTLRSHIIKPVYEGRVGNQTYALFSRLNPLSDYRIVRFLQKARASTRVAAWLTKLAQQTRKVSQEEAEYERLFLKPLESLAGDDDINPRIKAFARQSLEHIRKARPDLITIAQHGDFWSGNVLFERRFLGDFNPFLGRFSVIDWRGLWLDGYPGIDLVRFCLSIYKVGASRNNQLMSDYRAALDLSPHELRVYITIALGRLGQELDQFPKDRYCIMCDRIFGFAETHLIEH